MPIIGEYAPSPSSRAAKQVELYESSGGTRGTTLMGKPVVILTTVGAKTGKVRKTKQGTGKRLTAKDRNMIKQQK
jgi:hypothetical protein